MLDECSREGTHGPRITTDTGRGRGLHPQIRLDREILDWNIKDFYFFEKKISNLGP